LYQWTDHDKESGMTPTELKEWRERFGLTQTELAKRFGVSRNTIQNYESETTSIPSSMTQACAVWEDQFKKEAADLGPVTLCYADGPMWVDAYRPRNRTPFLHQEPFATNSAALARVKMIWDNNDVHGPFIMERSGNAVWNQVELARVVDGSDKNAPTVRNTIRRLAEYIIENKTAFVRGVRTPTVDEITAITASIQETGEALLQLATESETRCVTYVEFEVFLKRLHDLNTHPTNRQVGDIAHAIHGEEIVGMWQQI
jgi:DNA-binding XRE family transcriptional regulator